MTSVNLAGYHLSFDAEMTSSADMAQFGNTYANGDRYVYSNYEAEYYADNNPASPSNPFSFADGALTITATPTPVGSQAYTSGILTTAYTFSQNTGYFEIRAEVPTGAGFWPAFWLLAPDYSSEVDIMEQPNNDGPTNYFTSVKTSGLNAGAFNNAGVALSSGYHTYGFMWTPYAIQFTMDGQYIGYAASTPAGLATAKTYLIANLGVGGQYSWPGTPAAGASAQYKIDYIRVYSNDPTVAGIAPEPVSPPDLVPVTALPSIGTGPDSLVLQLNEDAYAGDAMFTVSVDGVQQGGVMTASAIASFSQTQSLTINGTFGTSLHTVAVDFLNDAWGGNSSMDRNLYVTQATIDGTAVAGSALTLFGTGTQTFSFGSSPIVTLGSGPDVLALQVAEDFYLTNAQFTVSVDGQQIGGVQTATVSKASGATQTFNVLGNFTGAHTVSVNFTNDAWGGSASMDRNLYVTQATIDGIAISGGALSLYGPGAQNFSFGSPAFSPVIVLGSGPDVLSLQVAEDAYQGNAQFTVSVDGTQIGGVQVASVSKASGATQTLDVLGNFATGPHSATVTLLNGAASGASAGPNLYVTQASIDSTTVPASSLVEKTSGPQGFSFQTPAATNPPASSALSPTLLTLHMAEDAYQGDAQFTISIDGVQLGAPQSVTALHNQGASQAFSFNDVLSAGTHDVAISFINDAYGSPSLDRNLYLVGADLKGVAQNPASWSAGFYVNGTTHFSLIVPS